METIWGFSKNDRKNMNDKNIRNILFMLITYMYTNQKKYKKRITNYCSRI